MIGKSYVYSLNQFEIILFSSDVVLAFRTRFVSSKLSLRLQHLIEPRKVSMLPTSTDVNTELKTFLCTIYAMKRILLLVYA